MVPPNTQSLLLLLSAVDTRKTALLGTILVRLCVRACVCFPRARGGGGGGHLPTRAPSGDVAFANRHGRWIVAQPLQRAGLQCSTQQHSIALAINTNLQLHKRRLLNKS